ncbi:MAG: hypothetical protein CBB68_11680 [Rhodospirillaceae bacterium TMED8]|nr:hypothetical protein [Magnetovibrio sp.]OUT49651.1 MAG: hypothetical protein CBB68_11680 [Rhodospirillaceae bacterium TMED8]|tara:strand:- start:656 stop:1495 length:840 start_codon:yes stop_codon:yes gene_type:complete
MTKKKLEKVTKNQRMNRGDKTANLKYLRQLIAHLEYPSVSSTSSIIPLTFGVSEIDNHLPWGGLMPAALHEIAAETSNDRPAALGFGAALLGLASQKAPVLWCRSAENLYAPGLELFQLNKDNLIFVNTSKNQQLLWSMEEGLRSGALAAVLGEINIPTLAAARRLQLAAEDGNTLAFLIPSGNKKSYNSTLEPSIVTAAVTCWQVASAPSYHPLGPWPGQARWRLKLKRCRGGKSGEWLMEWCDDGETNRYTNQTACGFRLATTICDRPSRPAQAGSI